MKIKAAIYAGSFDPFTNGHFDMVKEAASLFDHVIVLCAKNKGKEPVFPRIGMACAIDETLKKSGIHNTSVVLSQTLTADVCSQLGVEYLIRGLRSTTDFLYEEEIAKFNQRVNPKLKTIYLRAVDDTVSSSMVRELLSYGKDVSAYVPPEVLKVINHKS